MPTSLNSLLGGIYTGPSGFSGVSGFSGAGSSGFSGISGFSGAGASGFSGLSGFSGISGFSGTPGFNGGTVTNPIIVNNATVATSAGSGALQVVGGVGIGGNMYVSGNMFEGGLPVVAYDAYSLVTPVSISSSTLANLSGFSFPLGIVGATYGFQFYIVYQSPATGASLGAALTTPGFASFAARFFGPAGAAGTAGTFTGNIGASATKIQSVSVQAINVPQIGILEGVITVSTSGILQLQVSNSLNSTTTSQITILRGSAGWVWRIE